MARALAQNRIAKALRVAEGHGASEDDGLPAGHMRLYSFYKPSLQAGPYAIEAKQSISAIRGDDTAAQTLIVFNSASADKDANGNDQSPILQQEFTVIAPQFSLDPKLINTYYPPDGHQDEGRILPHIVFNDPHVPWLREAGLSSFMTGPVDSGVDGSDLKPDDKHGRNFVPWLALLVFKPDDLKIDAVKDGSLNLKDIASFDPQKQPASGAIPMTVGDYLSKVGSRVYYDAGYQSDSQQKVFNDELKKSTEKTSIIFPKKSQVQAIFGTQNDTIPLQAQKLLAHVRHINTVGFPDAGVEENGFYSIIVSSMTGDQKEVASTTHVVHLVSIEHMDATLGDPKSDFQAKASNRIGIVSLFSWTYTCIPDAVSFEDAMTKLADASQPLRPPTQVLDALLQKSKDDATKNNLVSSKASKALHDRLNAGYTIARWRTATGEETAAFNRGPLVPIRTKDIPAFAEPDGSPHVWPVLSMTGKDLQIFDKSLGIMDVTYSSAWSLGKLMAISDSVFNAALMRFRSTIWKEASSITRMQANGVSTASTILQANAVALNNAKGVVNGNFNGPVARVNIPDVRPALTAMNDPAIQNSFREAIDRTVDYHASAGGVLYNGYDGLAGNNSDWTIICNWLANTLFLANIPAHFLFPEPSHLQGHDEAVADKTRPSFRPESLRFFHVDNAWMDSFIDGALSCANHLEPKYDYTRLRIKTIFNHYLDGTIGKTGLKPPVPRYGFILRSSVVKSTPDLRLTVACWKLTYKADGSPNEWIEDPDRDPLIRHTRLDDFSILSLVDCAPEEICLIKMAQPPHQQRFALHCEAERIEATGLNEIKTHVKFKRLYTNSKWAPPVIDSVDFPDPRNAPQDPSDKLQWRELPSPKYQTDESLQADWYSADARCIKAISITKAATENLIKWGQQSGYQKNESPYDDSIPNSCVFGLEMNDPAYQLEINGARPVDLKPFPSWTRRLWTGQASTSAVVPGAARPNSAHFMVSSQASGSANTAPSRQVVVNPPPGVLKAAIPPTTFLNTSKPIPVVPVIKATTLVDPFVSSSDPQFELLIHPDYRPAPPVPSHAAHVRDDVFSPLDYIPTQTDYVYDLIFAIRRRNIRDLKGVDLQSITIEIPVSDDSDTNAKPIREPLLQAGDYATHGVRMCGNQRFVPALFNGPASSVGSKQWDSRPVLGIRLVPRSGTTSGTIELLNDGRSQDASVRLSEARIAPIKDSSTVALIAQGINPKTGRPWNGDKPQPRGRCMIKMTEHYGGTRGDQWSWCCALKINSGDKDPWGNVM